VKFSNPTLEFVLKGKQLSSLFRALQITMNNASATMAAAATVDESQYSAVELDAIWVQLSAQITPFTHVLNIPGDMFGTFDAGARNFVAENFW
jgi:hypothetical protein